MRRGMLLRCVAVLALLTVSIALALHRPGNPGGRYGTVQILKPEGAPRALVIFFPGRAQTAARRIQMARELSRAGAWVGLVDGVDYRANLRDSSHGCRAMADDAALFAQRLLQGVRANVFFPPLLGGQGDGAALVRDVMACASIGELAGAVVASAGPCTPPVDCTSPTSQRTVSAVADEALVAAATGRYPKNTGGGVEALPLVEMPVAGSHRLVVLLTGDGGWRDLDKGLAQALNQRGISVVGWNSLRYFWKEKSPQQLASDLDTVLRTYRQRWQADDVALVGYSFGADVLPFAYQLLPPQQRRSVQFVSLLGMAHGAFFEVRVGGWLGLGKAREKPVLPVLAGLRGVSTQCIYGVDEKDSLCRDLRGGEIGQVVERPGGHHFDRDPVKLAQIIIDGWDAAPAPQD
jgi:type IV secretory pathway VirJ component